MENILASTLGKEVHERLQGLVRQLQTDNARRSRRELAMGDRLANLEADLGFLALLEVTMLRLLDMKGLLGAGELGQALDFVDRMDGVADGALRLETVREAMGLPRAIAASQEELAIPTSTAKTKRRAPAPAPARGDAGRVKRPTIVPPAKNGRKPAAKAAKAARPAKAKGKKRP